MATRTAVGPKVLVVEGPDDDNVIWHVAGEPLRGLFSIQQEEGYPQLRENLDVRLDTPGLTHLGIVADANNDFTGRWQSLRDRLADCDIEVAAEAPHAAGTILVTAGRPTIGIWLMPNNRDNGMLEDFVWSLIPAADALRPLAVAAVDEVESADRRYPDGHTAKARIHTWLAWQAEPGMRMGAAVHRCDQLDRSAERAESLRLWLRRLFADTQPESASAEAGSSG